MTSIIRLEVLSGGMDESPPCYLLHMDDFTFLLDCGWDENFNMEIIRRLKKNVKKIDAVLLSQPDLYHLGALPYLVGKLGLKCPVYATSPIFKMGQMFLYDSFLNHHNTEDFRLFNLDDVDAAFDKIKQLEYHHTVALKGNGQGISISALPAGHMIGGSIWKISKLGEKDIYYAPEYNNKKERHLNGSDLEKIQRPGVLIINGFNALHAQEKRRKRDELLLSICGQTLRSGGNVLVATDSAGRSLELILMLDQMWKMKELAPYALVFMNNVAYNVIEFAKSQLEWMSEKLIKTFEMSKSHPFKLKHVIVCHTLIELSQIAMPKVVVTSSGDMESGFSRALFMQWCQDPRSCVVVTNRTSQGTLARQLIDEHSPGKCLQLEVKQRVQLQGKELEDYYCNKNQSNNKTDSVEILDIDETSNSSEGDLKIVENGDNNSTTNEVEILDVKSSHGMFPQPAKKKSRFDDYGEQINPLDFAAPKVKSNGTKRRFSFSCDNGETNNNNDARKRMKRNSSNGSDENEAPSKTICFTQPFNVNCKVHYIDFEGRSDIESVLQMLQQVNPAHLVLLRGPVSSLTALETLCQRIIPNSKVFKASSNTCVIDLTTIEGNFYQVQLEPKLLSSLKFSQVRGMELAWVDGTLNCNKVESPCLEKSESEMSSHETLYAHKLKLSEFKNILKSKGIESQITDHTLVVKTETGSVTVFRHGENRDFAIDATGLSDEYYTIRSLLYEQLAIL